MNEGKPRTRNREICRQDSLPGKVVLEGNPQVSLRPEPQNPHISDRKQRLKRHMQILTHESQFIGNACTLALGMFDGVHLGHQKLIRTAVELAQQAGIASVVDTFDAHPLQVLFPERAPQQLLTNEQRAERIAKLGVDVLVMRPFTKEYAAQPPETFLRELCAALRPVHIVVGFNYTFGSRGAGNVQLLESMAQELGYRLTVLQPVTEGGKTVSSTRIRKLMSQGDEAGAKKLLGLE